MSISAPTRLATWSANCRFIASPFPASGRAPPRPLNASSTPSSPSALKTNLRRWNSSSSIDPSPRTNFTPIRRWQSLALPALLPPSPIFFHRVRHRLRRAQQPVPFSSAQVLQDRPPLFFRSHMYICCLFSHGLQQPQFPSAGSERIQFDARTMRRQPPHDPVPPHLHIRIRAAHRPLQDRCVQNICWHPLRIQPLQSRSQQRLRFPRHFPAPPLRNRHQPRSTQASQTRHSPSQPVPAARLGQQMLNRPAGALWYFSFYCRKTIHFLPEHYRIPQFALRDRPQPLVALLQHKRTSALLHASFVSRQYCRCRFFRPHSQAILTCRQQRARRQPHQIHCVGIQTRFIKIVNAPHQAPIGISPGAEILHVQIAHRQNMRYSIQFRTLLRPDLQPAIESGPKERKKRRRHLLMLDPQIGLNNVDVQPQPILILLCSLNNVHGWVATI